MCVMWCCWCRQGADADNESLQQKVVELEDEKGNLQLKIVELEDSLSEQGEMSCSAQVLLWSRFPVLLPSSLSLLPPQDSSFYPVLHIFSLVISLIIFFI